MNVVYFSLLSSLLLIHSAEPLEVSSTYHNMSGVIADGSLDDGIYTVVSDSEIAAVNSNGVLSLRNTTGTFIEVNLNGQPDSLQAHKLREAIYVVASVHAQDPSLNNVWYCKYSYAKERLFCPAHHLGSPPTGFVTSTEVDNQNERIFVYVVYEQVHGYLTHYDIASDYEDSVRLPEGCSCNYSCLESTNQAHGDVIVKCTNGTSYLYNVYSGDFVVLLPGVKRVAKSNYKNILLATQPVKEIKQDIFVAMNVTTVEKHASTLLFPGTLASSSNPVSIVGVAIVTVNESSQSEVGYLLRGNNVSYVEIEELRKWYPKIKQSFLLPNVTPVAIKGIYGPTIVVECIHVNGSSVLVAVKADDVPSIRTPQLSVTPTTDNPPPGCHNRSKTHRPRPTGKPKNDTYPKEPATRSDSDGLSNNSIDFEYKSFIYGICVCLPIIVILTTILVKKYACYIIKRKSHDVENAKDGPDQTRRETKF